MACKCIKKKKGGEKESVHTDKQTLLHNYTPILHSKIEIKSSKFCLYVLELSMKVTVTVKTSATSPPICDGWITTEWIIKLDDLPDW